uniref:Uncharacterized protein n=1 Tax=Picea sitchensis TaxID=3332 RepID=D5ABN9_PICSI|nr:unknown [Picea sitchensis]
MFLCAACENNFLKPVNSTNARVVGQRAHGTLPFMFVHLLQRFLAQDFLTLGGYVEYPAVLPESKDLWD